MNTYLEVKNRILILCEEKAMTINKLSVESGISPSSLKNILYGKSKNPGIVTLKLICDGFKISLREFFDTETFETFGGEVERDKSKSEDGTRLKLK